MAHSGDNDCTNGGQVILDLQKFQIQPMDTLNTEHLQLVILSANPTPDNRSVENISSLPFSNSPHLTVIVPSENVAAVVSGGATALVSEDAALFLQDHIANATTLSEPVPDAGESLTNASAVNEKRFKCPQCEKHYSTPASLIRHIKTHSNEKPFKCDHCSKVFSRLSSLKRHQGSHAAARPFKCTVCGWAFLQNSDLKIHERTHTGEKPFACDRCEQAFGCKKRLRAHYRKHTGEKPYKCPECEKSFSMRKNVIQHIRIHTGERPFTCDVCKKTYRHQHTLKKHKQLHTVKCSASLSSATGSSEEVVVWPRKNKKPATTMSAQNSDSPSRKKSSKSENKPSGQATDEKTEDNEGSTTKSTEQEKASADENNLKTTHR